MFVPLWTHLCPLVCVADGFPSRNSQETCVSSFLDEVIGNLHKFLKGGLPDADGNEAAQKRLFGVLTALRRLDAFAL